MSHAHAAARRSFIPAIIAMLALALLLPGWVGANQQRLHQAHHGHHGKGKVVNTMTRNLYLGARLDPAFEAKNFDQFLDATGQILNEVVANDFPTRAKGLAQEMLRTKPDLVGLQEVALWRSTPLSPAATPVNYDYLELLLDELNRGKGKNGKGKPQYRVVVVQEEFDFEAPADANGIPGDGPGGPLADAEISGRLTMRDVILARRGAGVRTWNEQSAHFDTLLSVPILGELLPVLRGWAATDAKMRGSHPFRFVNTHLESIEPNVRAAQAGELVDADGPATSSLPVVLVGDINSDDDTVAPVDRLAYEALLAAGMVSRSTNDPLSCCLNSSLLAFDAGGSEADFDHQVDHILTRDPEVVTLKSSTVTGLEPVNGFWSSDHAGVFSALKFHR